MRYLLFGLWVLVAFLLGTALAVGLHDGINQLVLGRAYRGPPPGGAIFGGVALAFVAWKRPPKWARY